MIGIIAVAMFIGATPSGKDTFISNCSVCHGVSGKGDGPVGGSMNPRPADFTDPERKKKMTADKQVAIVTYGGMAGGLSASMPGFNGALTEQQILDVVDYVRGL